MQGSPGSKPIVAYITTAFPWRSETAVIKEMYQHHRLGFDIQVISLKRAAFDETIDPKALVFRDATLYPDAGLILRALLLSVHHLLFRQVYRSLLWMTLRRSGRHLLKALYLLVLAPELARRLVAKNVSYIHANFSSYQAYAALAIHRLCGIPFGFTVHAHDVFLHPFLVPEKVNQAELVVSISEFNVGYMAREFGVPASKIEVIHCGVDLAEFSLAPEPDDEVPLVLSVGRLVPMKGFDILIDACRRLAPEQNFHCVIVGNGPDFSALQEQIARMGMEGVVELRSGVPQDELVQLYQRCRLYVQACRVSPNGEMDGIPATLMEAMAVGKAVVASSLSGIPELIDNGQNGLLVPPEDADALADAMKAILSAPGRAAEMGRAGRAKVAAEFDVAINTSKLHDRIRTIVGAPASAATS